MLKASEKRVDRLADFEATSLDLVHGLERFMAKRDGKVTEAMIGRLFTDDDAMIEGMRRGVQVPPQRAARIRSLLISEGCDA